MPYKSAAQRGYFHAHKAELEAQGVNISEWDSASKGMKLPKKAKKKAGGGSVDDPIARVLKQYHRDRLGEGVGQALGQGVIPPEMLYLQKGIDPKGGVGDRNIRTPDDLFRGQAIRDTPFRYGSGLSYDDGGRVGYFGNPDQGRYGRHGLDLNIPLDRNTDITGRGSIRPEPQAPRQDFDVRLGLRRRFADGGAADYELGNDVPPSFRDSARGVVGAFSKMGDYLGVPQEDIRNKQGDIVFPTNAVERGLQGSDRPTKEFAGGVLGGGGGPGGGPGAYQGMFVGPYGALALRNRAMTPENLRALEHPVVRAAKARGEDPWLGITDPAKRDDVARDLLEYRRQAGDPRDEDIWRGSGWFRGEEGAAKKEIPDIGAKLVRPNKHLAHDFVLDHPAGDFHSVYDIPRIQAKRDIVAERMGATAGVNPRTSDITIYGDPSRSRMNKATSDVLHEIQHIIQEKEGFATGSSPQMAKGRPTYEQELGRPFKPEDYPNRFGKLSPEQIEQWIKEDPKRAAALRAYFRSGGEAESRNIEDRRRRGFSYLSHPEETSDVSPGLLDVYRSHEGYPTSWLTKPTKRASGGGLPFNLQHAESRQLVRNGMLHSAVPGRTDNLNIKVPSGSYVIPADVVSGIGQGNTMGGAAIMQKMFSSGPPGSGTGPLGMPAGIKTRGGRGAGHAARLGTTKLPKGSKTTSTISQTFADGGPTGPEIQNAEAHAGEPTPIDAAGGEYLVHPAVVRRLGRGSLKQGHEVLDAFVLHARKNIIKQMQDLKPPVKSSQDEGGGDDMSDGADYYKAITGDQP